jgi:hypothetical protein
MADIHKYQQNNICNKWNEDELIYKDCKIKVDADKNGNIAIKGTIDLSLSNKYETIILKYWAPAPPDVSQSFTSSLPYANKEMAYSNTKNTGAVKVSGNSFVFYITQPNSYYANLGTKYIEPEVRFRLYDKDFKRISQIYITKLGPGVPYRTLNYHQSRNPLFYKSTLENSKIRTQCQILLDSCYNRDHPGKSFWGGKPPK